MKSIVALLALAVVACGSPEPELAAPSAPSTPPQAHDPLDDDPSRHGRTHVSFSFDELDLNDDGSIAETESAFDASLSKRFAKADANGDGKLSRIEFDVARAAAAAAGQ